MKELAMNNAYSTDRARHAYYVFLFARLEEVLKQLNHINYGR